MLMMGSVVQEPSDCNVGVRYRWAKVGAQDQRRPLGHYPLVDTIRHPIV